MNLKRNREVHIGVLGAARITKTSLITPAKEISGVYADAIAARNVDRAQAQARQFGMFRVHSSHHEPDPQAGARTMQVIDSIYLAAGMNLRQPQRLIPT